MKKITILCTALLLSGYTATKAQGILDKIDRASYKVDRAGNSVDRAGNSANRTKSTGDKIMGIFGKKNKDAAESSGTKTTIKITGGTFAALKNLNTKIQGSKEVSSTKMKFSNSGSSIVVQHSGSTDDLLKTLQKASPEIFSEKNIEGLDDGKIEVKVN